jgi:ParB family chromosome partitioning protein
MAEGIRLVDPSQLDRNPENPRLIFRLDELELLQDSIKNQGILVPLTVYLDARRYVLLDGERRWRCALKLGLSRVPVIVQPKPDRLRNLMMMFAIHNQRRDWDPLPTAFKLRDLDEEFTRDRNRAPTEAELAELASISRGEVRRLRNILNLPVEYHDELLAELEKPRHEQVLTVDQVLEATRGALALRKRDVIDAEEEHALGAAVIDKFKLGVIHSTVEPRKLARIARAVERGEVTLKTAKSVVAKLISRPTYTIGDAFADSAAQIDYVHGTEQLATRLSDRLYEQLDLGYDGSEALRDSLKELRQLIDDVLER